MSQTTSFTLPNQSRTSYRLSVNDVFAALASQNSGVTAPPEPHEFMVWHDTSGSPTILIKQRNASNSAWITIAVMDGSGVRPYYNGTVVTSVVSRAVGTSPNNVLALDAGAKIPAVDGSQLVGISSRAAAPPEISANVVDSEHDTDIATGMVTMDQGVSGTMPALTKRIDAAWAIGTNNGGLDTGTVAANTWYALWAIRRPDTGVIDAMYSTGGVTPASLPANYTQYRRLGWRLTDGSANLIPFTQIGDDFWWLTTPLDLNGNPGAGINITVTTPPSVRGVFVLHIQESTGDDISTGVLYPTWATAWPEIAYAKAVSGGTGGGYGQATVPVDGNSQIRAVDTGSPNAFRVYTVGWTDRRGRDD